MRGSGDSSYYLNKDHFLLDSTFLPSVGNVICARAKSLHTNTLVYIHIHTSSPKEQAHGSCNGTNWVLLASGKNEKIWL